MKVNFAPPEVKSVLKPSSPSSQYDSFHDMRQLGVLPPPTHRWDANSLLGPPPPNISSSFPDNFLVPIYNRMQLFEGPI